ncbi:MAG: hypothetical protein V1725_03200 [archaeon]
MPTMPTATPHDEYILFYHYLLHNEKGTDKLKELSERSYGSHWWGGTIKKPVYAATRPSKPILADLNVNSKGQKSAVISYHAGAKRITTTGILFIIKIDPKIIQHTKDYEQRVREQLKEYLDMESEYKLAWPLEKSQFTSFFNESPSKTDFAHMINNTLQNSSTPLFADTHPVFLLEIEPAQITNYDQLQANISKKYDGVEQAIATPAYIKKSKEQAEKYCESAYAEYLRSTLLERDRYLIDAVNWIKTFTHQLSKKPSKVPPQLINDILKIPNNTPPTSQDCVDAYKAYYRLVRHINGYISGEVQDPLGIGYDGTRATPDYALVSYYKSLLGGNQLYEGIELRKKLLVDLGIIPDNVDRIEHAEPGTTYPDMVNVDALPENTKNNTNWLQHRYYYVWWKFDSEQQFEEVAGNPHNYPRYIGDYKMNYEVLGNKNVEEALAGKKHEGKVYGNFLALGMVGRMEAIQRTVPYVELKPGEVIALGAARAKKWDWTRREVRGLTFSKLMSFNVTKLAWKWAKWSPTGGKISQLTGTVKGRVVELPIDIVVNGKLHTIVTSKATLTQEIAEAIKNDSTLIGLEGVDLEYDYTDVAGKQNKAKPTPPENKTAVGSEGRFTLTKMPTEVPIIVRGMMSGYHDSEHAYPVSLKIPGDKPEVSPVIIFMENKSPAKQKLLVIPASDTKKHTAPLKAPFGTNAPQLVHKVGVNDHAFHVKKTSIGKSALFYDVLIHEVDHANEGFDPAHEVQLQGHPTGFIKEVSINGKSTSILDAKPVKPKDETVAAMIDDAAILAAMKPGKTYRLYCFAKKEDLAAKGVPHAYGSGNLWDYNYIELSDKQAAIGLVLKQKKAALSIINKSQSPDDIVLDKNNYTLEVTSSTDIACEISIYGEVYAVNPQNAVQKQHFLALCFDPFDPKRLEKGNNITRDKRAMTLKKGKKETIKLALLGNGTLPSSKYVLKVRINAKDATTSLVTVTEKVDVDYKASTPASKQKVHELMTHIHDRVEKEITHIKTRMKPGQKMSARFWDKDDLNFIQTLIKQLDAVKTKVSKTVLGYLNSHTLPPQVVGGTAYKTFDDTYQLLKDAETYMTTNAKTSLHDAAQTKLKGLSYDDIITNIETIKRVAEYYG